MMKEHWTKKGKTSVWGRRQKNLEKQAEEKQEKIAHTKAFMGDKGDTYL